MFWLWEMHYVATEDGMEMFQRSRGRGWVPTGSPPAGRFEGSHAASMLQQLIDEANTKFVAYSEEVRGRLSINWSAK